MRSTKVIRLPGYYHKYKKHLQNLSEEEFKSKFFSQPKDQGTIEIKEEVFEFISKKKNIHIDFRKFGALIDLRVANPHNWKELAEDLLKRH